LSPEDYENLKIEAFQIAFSNVKCKLDDEEQPGREERWKFEIFILIFNFN